jgi:hypothetical protein
MNFKFKFAITLFAVAVISSSAFAQKHHKADKCDKSYYIQEWDHQAPTVDAYNFV